MKRSNTLVTIVITVLVMIILFLVGYITYDKYTNNDNKSNTTNTATNSDSKSTSNKIDNTDTKTDTNNNSKEENTKTNETTSNGTSLTDDQIKDLMANYIKEKMPSVVEYKINSLNFDNNTKDFKDMINEDQDNILVYVDYDVKKEDGYYTRESGWINASQAHCILTKENGQYKVEKCGTGW